MSQPMSVLVADIDPVAAQSLGRILHGAGVPVVVCTTMAQLGVALRSLERALLFIDLHFHKPDSFELIERLLDKANQVNRHYIICATSRAAVDGKSSAELAMKAAQVGAFRYVTKPVVAATVQQLLQEAQAAIEERVQQQAAAQQKPPEIPDVPSVSSLLMARGASAPLSSSPGALAPLSSSPGASAPPAAPAQPVVPGDPYAAAVSTSSLLMPPDAPASASSDAFSDAPASASSAPVQSSPAPAPAPFAPHQTDAEEEAEIVAHEDFSPLAHVHNSRMQPLNRLQVLQAPEEPGVITFFDEKRKPVIVEWAGNLCQRLQYYLGRPATLCEVRAAARFFEVLATMDNGQEAKVFDRLVNEFGEWPSLMREAPAGARNSTPPGGEDAHGEEVVTHYQSSSDPKLIARVRELIEQNPTEPALMDWIAFTLYSNNLLDESITWYIKLFKAGSHQANHYFYCANALYKKGFVDRALKMWQVAAKLEPNSVIARKSQRRMDAVKSGGDPGLTMI